MAKKSKKKLVKLNNKIKYYFGDLGFDSGLELVETPILSELAQSMGIVVESASRKELLRSIRRLYSQSDIDIREMILHFFEQNGRRYLPKKDGANRQAREEILTQIAQELQLDTQEYSYISEAFKEVRSRKITKEKVLNTLEHRRYELKRQEIEMLLRGSFTLEDAFEFSHAFSYAIFDENFKKIHTLQTKRFDIDHLKESPIDRLLEEISEAKRDAVAKFERELEQFLSTLKAEHLYLQESEIIATLKGASPDERFYDIGFSLDIYKRIIKNHLDTATTLLHKSELVITTHEEYHHKLLDASFAYELELFLHVKELNSLIWQQKPLDIESKKVYFKASIEESFNEDVETILEGLDAIVKLLSLDKKVLYSAVVQELRLRMDNHLHIGSRGIKKVIKELHNLFYEQIVKRQKEQFLARSIRDFKNLFPLARELRRELVFHVGPTNSGKTYSAMQELKASDTGYYLVPLRLLALEGYETLKEGGIDASLITGEEQILDEDATHISSTIEMLNFDVDVDLCVIDEVQMIGDSERGWAWANAIIGAPAKRVIMTGSQSAKEAIVQLAKYLNEPLTIVEFERKAPLELMKRATPFDAIAPQSAIVAFSRADVLKLRNKLAKKYRVSVVYGNLSPEVRREEARRFREGETQLLIATDAIAMGLNLPITTLLFYKSTKFDGKRRRRLYASEIHQISGRAGRYGYSQKGFVGALDGGVLREIQRGYHQEDEPIAIPFNVMANLEHIKLIGSILEQESLLEILHFFVENMKFSGPFRASNLEAMIEIAKIVDAYKLSLSDKYYLSVAPVTTSSDYIMERFESFVSLMAKEKVVPYVAPKLQNSYASTMQELLSVEDWVKEISLYLWLSYRFEKSYPDAKEARAYRDKLNSFIENSLKKSYFIPRCRTCTKPLPLHSEHAICNSCYRRLYQKSNRSAQRYR